MTVTYAGQSFTKNIATWLGATRAVTHQSAGNEELAFALFASTGGAWTYSNSNWNPSITPQVDLTLRSSM